MSVRDRPWMKFYPADWRADPVLRNCGLAARGLWMEMLALMHESERYGYLLVNGKTPSDRQLAIQSGALVDEVQVALAELESEGVFSRDRNGVIYSRRMIRDEKRAEHARKIGRKGGNPNLGKQKETSAQDNRQDKPRVNGGVKPHMPEARVQKVEASPTSRPPTLPGDVEAVMDAAGWTHPPGDLRLLKAWYGLGATLVDDIVPVVRRQAANMRNRGDPPKMLKVFDAAIREKLAEDQAQIEHFRKVAARNAPQSATGPC